MFRNAIHLLGVAIDNTSRAAYRKVLGLRIPAAHIRLADIAAARDYCARRLADSLSDAAYWREQLRLSETALATAEWDHARLLHTIDSRSRGNNP